jgi:hypothetical protein
MLHGFLKRVETADGMLMAISQHVPRIKFKHAKQAVALSNFRRAIKRGKTEYPTVPIISAGVSNFF